MRITIFKCTRIAYFVPPYRLMLVLEPVNTGVHIKKGRLKRFELVDHADNANWLNSGVV